MNLLTRPSLSDEKPKKENYSLIIKHLNLRSRRKEPIRRINWANPIHSSNLFTHQTLNAMVFRYLTLVKVAPFVLLLSFITLGIQGFSQLHHVMVEPSNAVYSSTCEISDGSQHSLIASTTTNGSPENHVRISRVKTNGSLQWEKDYFTGNGWRASHVLTVNDEVGVLIGVGGLDTIGTPVHSLVMTFDLTTGASLALVEIEENNAAAAKGMVLTHGIFAQGQLILTGWLGGTTGTQLAESRVSVLMGIPLPDATQSSVVPNWIHALNTSGPQDGPDYDMGSHVMEVAGTGYFMSGSGNAYYENAASAGFHQAPLASLVAYDGSEIWSKVVPYWYPGEGDNQPFVPLNQRHAVASCATSINLAGGNNPNQQELIQTVNWVRNRGLTTLRYNLSGTAIEAKGLHLDGAYTFPFAETSIKGYAMYRAINSGNPSEVTIAGYVNDPEYLDSDPSTGPKDRVPFLMTLDVEGTTTGDYLVGHNIYAGSPSTNYGDDPGIHSGNSQMGQQPIIFHPEMMDVRESAPGYGLLGHRRTHDSPVVFDPSILHVDATGADAFGSLTGCEDFAHPMTIEFPIIDPFSPFNEDVNLVAVLKDVSLLDPSTTPTPCDEYFICDVSLDVTISTDTCNHYILTASNLGSTPMSQLELYFDRGLDGVLEQSGTADGSDGSGNPSYDDLYPSGVATQIKVALICQGVEYAQIITLTPDCPDDDCTPDNDLTAALTQLTTDICSIEYTLFGAVTPVADASIVWTLNGDAVPSANGQWSYTFNDAVENTSDAYANGTYSGELCATVTCPDGATNTACLPFEFLLESPIGLDMWLYCGQGCWGGMTGTRAAITFDMALFNLNESEYDAEVCFSDGTTMPLNLDSPVSIIKCFSGFTLFRNACLKIYEEGELALGGDPCYEVCDSETCLSIETLPFELAEAILPRLAVDASACSLQADALPDFITSMTQVMVFGSQYPGGDDATAFISGFLNGEDFSESASSFPLGSVQGSYQVACNNLLETQLVHPVQYCSADNPSECAQEAINAGPNAILVAGLPQVQVSAAYIPGDTYILGDTYIPGDTYSSESDPIGSTLDFANLIALDPVLAGVGWNTWNLSGSAGPGGTSFLSPENDCSVQIGDGSLGEFYDNGLLGSAGFTLEDDTYIPISTTGQACPNHFNYLTQATLEIFNTASLFEEEDDFPMSEWTPFEFVGNALLTDEVLSPNAPGASTEELVIDYYDGYGDSSGPWSMTDASGNVVATGIMPEGPEGSSGPLSSTGSVNLAPGHYTFSWELDCYGVIDNSSIQLSLNGATLVNFPSGTVLPGIITVDIFIPGIVIVPTPTAAVDTTCNAVFTHDLLLSGPLPSSTPGTYVLSEDNIQLGFDMFFDGFGATYGSASIGPALPTAGSGQVLTTSNINAVYDMSAFPNVNEVSFVFFDGAGDENLKVNGHTLLTGELETMPSTVAPGVSMTVTTSAYPGYQTGTVVLTGNVQKLEIGGQQFYVDHICVKHDGTVIPILPTGACTATCDVFTGFDLLTAGDRYGDLAEGANISVAVGGLAVTSDGVPIHLEPLHDFSAAYYNYMAVDAHYGGWGSGMSLWTNNITAQFDIESVVPMTDTVCIAFRDEGGFENLWINGAPPLTGPNGYGGLTIFNGINVGGVQVQVAGAMVGGYAYEGTITLIGDVDKFSIGGQELWLDDLCISSVTTLANAAEDMGEEALEEGLGLAVVQDTAACQFVVSINPTAGYPTFAGAVIQYVGTQTGTVYANFPADNSGITLIDGPEPTENGETLVLAIELQDGDDALTLQFEEVTLTPCYCVGALHVEVPSNYVVVDIAAWNNLNTWTPEADGFGAFEDAEHISWNSFCTAPPAPGSAAATTFNVVVSPISGSCAGSFQVLFQAYNCCGSDDEYIIFNVADTTPPVITLDCPADATISFEAALVSLEGACTAAPDLTGWATANATDNVCDDLYNALGYVDAISDADGNVGSDVNCFLGGYTIVRTWTATATDCCDNTASLSCDQIIEVTNTTLTSAAAVLGDEGLLQMIDYSLSGVPCYTEFLFDLGDLASLTSSVDVILTNANGDEEGEATDNGDGTFILTTTSIDALNVSLVLVSTSSNATLTVTIPDIVVPVCPVVPGCIAIADFVQIDNGDCTRTFVYTGSPGTLEWTVNGVPQGATGVVYNAAFAPGVYTICVTVIDANDPECIDTYCESVDISCSNSNPDCDVEFTHEDAPFSGVGAVSIPGPNAVVATEDGIHLSFREITYADGSNNFGVASIQLAQPEAGTNQVLNLNNIMAVYDLLAVGTVTEVRFEFLDYGGQENLLINGSLVQGELDGMGGIVLGGANVQVNSIDFGSFTAGEVILSGGVQELGVAGQEFYIDNICVITDDTACADTDGDGICDADETSGCTDSTADNYNENATDDDGTCDYADDNDTTQVNFNFAASCPSHCDWLVDFGSQPMGTSWGNSASAPTFALPPGALMFNEGGVDMYIGELNSTLYGVQYNLNAITPSPWAAFGTGQVMHTNNATVTFDLDSIPTDSVCLDILDLGGFEFLEVNGVSFSSMNGYGQLTSAPMSMGGVQVQILGNPIITTTSTGPQVTGFNGRLVLHGNVDKLEIGGQEFWIDNLCISSPPPPPSLAEVVESEGEEGLLNGLTLSFDTDTNQCQTAMALQLQPGFPAIDSLSLHIINSLTGEVVLVQTYCTGYCVAGDNGTATNGFCTGYCFAGDGDSGGPLINMATNYGLISSIIPLPNVEIAEDLTFSLVFWDIETTVVVEIPGFTVPGCPGGGIELPCDVDATFAVLETPCGVFTVLSAPQIGTVEMWTLDGLPYAPTGDPHAFSMGLSEGVHTLCRTVTSTLLPNCSDTYCHPLIVDCSSDSCDFSFTHEYMSFGAVNTALTYTEDHIDLSFAGYDDGLGSGPSMGNAFVDFAVPGIGDNQVLLLSNVNADYDLTGLVNVSRVTFDYFDGAGIENLMVNGSFMIDEFGALAGSTFSLGGVDVFIARVSAAGYDHGEVILTGNVQSFAVGGQQFYVDNVCVSADGVNCTADSDQDGTCDDDEVPGCTNGTADNYDPTATDDDGSCEFGYNDTTEVIVNFAGSCPSSCDALIDFESQTMGSSWGNPASGPVFPLAVGDWMFNESGIDMYINALNSALYGTTYNMNLITTSPWASFGTGQVMHTNNATVTFDLDSITTDSVCLDILDLGGFEFLEVNGVGFSSLNGYGQLNAAPVNMGGVQVQVIGNPIITMTSAGPMVTGFNGRLVLNGNVNQLEIGGQEFWIDNLCIGQGAAIAPAVPGCTYEGAENYDPSATEDDGSCILPEMNPCPTDIDGDGITATQDLLLLLSSFSLECNE